MNATNTAEETGSGLPKWLNNGQTVAIIGTTLTVAVAIGTMIFASTSAIRGELRAEIQRVDTNMKDMRAELKADIEGVRAEIKVLDGRLRVVEQTMAAVNARLRVVEQTVATVHARVTRVAGASGVEEGPTSLVTRPAE